MSEFRIKPKASDPKAIRDLVANTGVFSGIEAGWAEEIIETALSRPENCGYHFLFADGPDALQGFTCFGPIEGTDNRFDLYWIAVSPQAQGQRLGHRLLEHSIKAAQALGATHMFIDTSTRIDYAAARALYKSHGFELMGMLTDFYSDGDSKALFGRKL